MRMEYEVDMADGETHKVAIDGRDYAKMECFDLPSGAVYTRARYLAWSAMTREKLTRLAFKQFNEDHCLEVRDVTRDDEPAEEDDVPAGDLDPTQ